ncbi:MAG: hypothetical protein ACRCR6_12385 [Plesiomonas sp.]
MSIPFYLRIICVCGFIGVYILFLHPTGLVAKVCANEMITLMATDCMQTDAAEQLQNTEKAKSRKSGSL